MWITSQWSYKIQGGAKVGLQLYVKGKFTLALLTIVLSSTRTTANLLLPHPINAYQDITSRRPMNWLRRWGTSDVHGLRDPEPQWGLLGHDVFVYAEEFLLDKIFHGKVVVSTFAHLCAVEHHLDCSPLAQPFDSQMTPSHSSGTVSTIL